MAAPNQVRITLNSAGVCSGPCDIYSNTDGFVTPIATGVTIAQLTGIFGFLVNVPFGTTTIRVQNSNNNCSNFEQVVVQA